MTNPLYSSWNNALDYSRYPRGNTGPTVLAQMHYRYRGSTVHSVPSPRYYCEIIPIPTVITAVTAVLPHSPLPCHSLVHSSSYLLLSLAEGQVLELVDTEAGPFGEFHEISGGVRAGAEDEDYRRERRALFPDELEAYDRRHDVLLTHSARDEVRHGQVDTIDAETAEQHQSVETTAQFTVRHRE